MNMPQLRSPHSKVGGLFHFGRMIDKIRANAVSPLGPDYEPTLGKGFDGRVCNFLRISYQDLRDHALTNPDTDEEQECRVVFLGDAGDKGQRVGIEFLSPAPRFWGVDFDAGDSSN